MSVVTDNTWCPKVKIFWEIRIQHMVLGRALKKAFSLVMYLLASWSYATEVPYTLDWATIKRELGKCSRRIDPWIDSWKMSTSLPEREGGWGTLSRCKMVEGSNHLAHVANAPWFSRAWGLWAWWPRRWRSHTCRLLDGVWWVWLYAIGCWIPNS